MSTDLLINEKWKRLLVPLKEEEMKHLKDSLVREGCREPLIIWNGYILDGHNRYELCKKHGIGFRTLENDAIADEIEAEEWIICNQVSSRNLDSPDRCEYGLELEKLFAVMAANRMKSGMKIRMNNHETDSHNIGGWGGTDKYYGKKGKALAQAAQKCKVGRETLRKYKHIKESQFSDILESVKTREISIGQGFEEVKRREFQRREFQRFAELSFPVFPKDQYRVLYANPSWELPAPNRLNILLKTLCGFPIQDLCERECVLFLWALDLISALKVIEAWGFTYKDNIVWDKQRSDRNNYVYRQHELLLIATRGACLPDLVDTSVQSVWCKPEHGNKKPKEFKDLIEKMYRNGKRLRMFFENEEEWEGWDNWNMGEKDV